ncbi:hypothetical protein M885DRAFT_92996 [Pelagophyceae sp. CCMP2097]|nr:hypothetical protein M885DRAFT_92996 [Pelagophyceae sp. CCMP2097]
MCPTGATNTDPTVPQSTAGNTSAGSTPDANAACDAQRCRARLRRSTPLALRRSTDAAKGRRRCARSCLCVTSDEASVTAARFAHRAAGRTPDERVGRDERLAAYEDSTSP